MGLATQNEDPQVIDLSEGCQSSKRGRPKKILHVAKSQIINKLSLLINEALKTINTKKIRSDSRRMQLVRLAKKLPLEILRLVEPKSKYKSSNKSFVTEAYFNAFIRF